jgi:hypothetical protein
VRDAEEISLGISLRPSPDNQESTAKGANSNGRDAFARSRPWPDVSPEDEGYREAGANGRNGDRPIKDGDLQEERTSGRTGTESNEEDSSMGPCIHGYPAGKGCFLCDPNHPLRVKERMAT